MTRRQTPKPVAYPPEAFDRLPQMQITLTRETCWLTRFEPDGKPNTTYPVRASEVARAFNVFNVSTGLLPPDVLFVTQVGNQTRIGIWLPPAVRALRFETRRAETVRCPLPGFVFVGQGVQYFIYAVAERPTHHGAALFHAPLPNVNDSGLICAGTVKFPPCNASTIRAAADLFFESAFNLDLSVGKFNPDGGRDENRDARPEMVRDDDYPGTTYDDNEYADDDEDIDGDDPRLMVATPREIGARVRPRRARRERSLLQFLKALKRAENFPLAKLVPARVTLKALMGGKSQ